jgi:predicted RNA-binding Zn ribbon-like protein
VSPSDTIRSVTETYAGPLRDEPLAVELHNTIYASGGSGVDGLADAGQAAAWIAAIGDRMPLAGYPEGPPPSRSQLRELRNAVRSAFAAALDGTAADAAALAAINAASASAPCSPAIRLAERGALARASDFHGATRAQAMLAAFARDAIEILTGPQRDELRVCGAPGCVLLFLRDHPRREWCSNACGNRARQARHYQRVRGG